MKTITLNQPVQFYVPITRVDPETRIVEGYCYVNPKVRGDKWNLTRAAMEKATEAYMQMPAIRAMHTNIAAGVGHSAQWDDKGCLLRAEIVDDQEWRKVEKGVYRGFSIGGRPKVARGNDVEVFDWIETSLVDRPCDPDALFTMARVDDASAPYEVEVDDSSAPVAPTIDQEEVDGQGTSTEDDSSRQSGSDGSGAGDAAPAGAGATGEAAGVGESADSEPGQEDPGRGRLRGDEAAPTGGAAGDAQAEPAPGAGDSADGAGSPGVSPDGEGQGVVRAALADSYAGYLGNVAAPTFKERTGAVLNDVLYTAFQGAQARFFDTLMMAPDIEARHRCVAEYAAFLDAWLDHDEQLRAELGLQRGESDLFQRLLPTTQAPTEGSSTLLQRVETAEAELSRVQEDLEVTRRSLSTAEGEVARLRALPLNNKPVVQFPAAPLPREFTVNRVLGNSNEHSARRAQLIEERNTIMQSTEEDPMKRQDLARRVMRIDQELSQLNA